MLTMHTNNAFADYLLNENRSHLYAMSDHEAAWAFVRFFHEPLIVFNEENQGMLARVESTTYLFELTARGGDWSKMPAAAIPLIDRFMIDGKYSLQTTAGGVVSSDWCSESDAYGDEWCRSHTIEVLGQFEIYIEAGDYDYSIKLRARKEGFEKTEYGWIRRKIA